MFCVFSIWMAELIIIVEEAIHKSAIIYCQNINLVFEEKNIFAHVLHV